MASYIHTRTPKSWYLKVPNNNTNTRKNEAFFLEQK